MAVALPASPAGALGRPPASARLCGELDRLAAMDAASLRRRWRMVFGSILLLCPSRTIDWTSAANGALVCSTHGATTQAHEGTPPA